MKKHTKEQSKRPSSNFSCLPVGNLPKRIISIDEQELQILFDRDPKIIPPQILLISGCSQTITTMNLSDSAQADTSSVLAKNNNLF